MEYSKYQTLDLNKHIPQVVLIGNGLARCSNNPCWEKTIKEIAADGCSEEQLSEKLKKIKKASYTVKSSVMLDTEDKTRQDKYVKFFTDPEKYHYAESYETLGRLLSLNFDAVLTTNYTYEIEECLQKGYTTVKNNLKYASCTFPKSESYDKKRLLRTYNSAGGKNIWHIHGELRRKSSLILTHDEYSRLIADIVTYNKQRGNDYEKFFAEMKFRSWVDYLILGDVYIIGLGLDFSEFDLWWLISRKKRERAHRGNIYYFCPESDNGSVRNSVKLLGFEAETFNINISDNKETQTEEYNIFYKKAVDRISEIVIGK